MWKFKPIFKTTIWGGEKIAPFKGVRTELNQVGESWELSGVAGFESIVVGGADAGLTLPQLISKYGSALLGKSNFSLFGNRFPLLIKFIDAREDLSVQVHPDDAMARKYGERNGKTEMWFVLEAEEGAKLANGFKREVDPSEYEALIESGEIEQLLNFNQIAPGDTYFIPAGRVHAIGKGAFVAEIQQTSDATYRLYDYHRKDKEGKERELHTELAKEAINFKDTEGKKVDYTPQMNHAVNLSDTPFFTTNLLTAESEVERDYSKIDSFVVLIATEGEATLRNGVEELTLRSGTTILIPASTQTISIIPSSTFTCLETYIRS